MLNVLLWLWGCSCLVESPGSISIWATWSTKLICRSGRVGEKILVMFDSTEDLTGFFVADEKGCSNTCKSKQCFYEILEIPKMIVNIK